MSLITTIIDGLKPNPSSGLGGANEGYIQGFQDDLINGVAGGVVDKAGGQCLVTQNSPLGMSVLVADGVVYVPNADYIANLASTTKYYRVVIKAEDPVVIPSNSSGSTCQHGLDVVIDKVEVPNEYASNVATIVLTLGTPGAGAPAVPDNGYRLAEVEVVSGATQIANASITDTRTQIAINTLTLGDVATLTGTQTLINKTLTSPKVGTAILDTNGNEVIKTPATASAVNEITVTNSATGNAVQVSATGGDTDIDITVLGKGSGSVKLGTAGLKFPNTDGTADYVIKTDGSGQLSFVAQATSSTDGWTSAGETWTYASASTITVPSGAAAKYAKGDRIKFTQTTVKYAVIVAVADTVLTIAVNTDYTVANAAITDNYYSHQASPLGYPSSFTYTVNATSGWTATISCSYKYSILGNVCFIYSDGDFTGGGTSNATTIVVPLPMTCATSVYGTLYGYGRDNGSNVSNPMYAEVTGAAMTIYKGFFQTAFTTSGAKAVFGLHGSVRF